MSLNYTATYKRKKKIKTNLDTACSCSQSYYFININNNSIMNDFGRREYNRRSLINNKLSNKF